MNKIIERRLANGSAASNVASTKPGRICTWQIKRGRVGFTGAFGHAGKQLGLHGDGGLGLKLKSLVGAMASRKSGSLAGTSP